MFQSEFVFLILCLRDFDAKLVGCTSYKGSWKEFQELNRSEFCDQMSFGFLVKL